MNTFSNISKKLIIINMLYFNIASAETIKLEPIASDPLISEQNRLFITDAFAEWADGQGSFFQSVLSPDVIWTIKGSGPTAGTYIGRDAFIEQAVAPFVARIAKPLKPSVKAIWADQNDVIVYWDGTAVATDGVIYNNSYVWIFKMKDLMAIEVIAFLDLTQYDDVINRIQLNTKTSKKGSGDMKKQAINYTGMWVTNDGRIRHQLLANNRYDEARDNRKSAYQGRYEINNNQINYWDDTGFTADGIFVDENTLHHAGMVMYRQR